MVTGVSTNSSRSSRTAKESIENHFGPGHIATEAVRVADGHEPNPGRLGRCEVTPVAGALTGPKLLHLGQATLPAQYGLQIVVGRILAERRKAVESDTAASGIEARLWNTKDSRAIGDVARQPGIGLCGLAKAFDLGAGEIEIAVGGGQVAHQPDDIPARRGDELREAEAPHARVELEVSAYALRYVRVHNGYLESRLTCPRDLGGKEWAHHENTSCRVLGTQLEPLGKGNHAKSTSARAERRAGRVHGPMPVRIRLHDRPKVGPVESGDQALDIAAKRTEVDRELGAVHRFIVEGWAGARLASCRAVCSDDSAALPKGIVCLARS